MNNIIQILTALKIKYKNLNYYQEAFTHASYLNEKKGYGNDYQRMEFLGDTILSFVVSKYLYENYPDYEEGKLTQMRLNLVDEASLAKFARKLNLGPLLFLGHGAEKSNLRELDSILCDIFESFIAAIYLDSGLEEAEKFILSVISHQEVELKDPKSKLQEYLQAGDKRSVEYKIIAQEGPSNDPSFTCAVLIEGVIYGTGSGKTKKEAEKQAARNALSKLVA